MSPRRFLLVLHDAGGTVPPMLAVGAALVGRGHAVTVLSQPCVAARATAGGCGFVPFSEVPDYRRDRPLEEQVDLVFPAMAGPSTGRDLLRVAEREQSDVIVVDCNLAGAAAAAESSGARSALLFHSLYATFVDTWFGELWPFFEGAVNDTRATFGLGPCDSWDAVFRAHELYGAWPPGFEPTSTPVPPDMRHFGFLVPGSGAEDVALPRDDLRVLVSLSTGQQGHRGLLQTIVDAVAERDLAALVTTGGALPPGELDAPDRVAVVDYIPHQVVVPKVDVVVTHAGLGTIAVALSHGVPLVCLPIGRDQPLNAAQVQRLGLGEVVEPATATSALVGAAIDVVLGDARYGESARVFARTNAELGGAEAAALDLERVATDPAAPRGRRG